ETTAAVPASQLHPESEPDSKPGLDNRFTAAAVAGEASRLTLATSPAASAPEISTAVRRRPGPAAPAGCEDVGVGVGGWLKALLSSARGARDRAPARNVVQTNAAVKGLDQFRVG